MVSTVQLVVFTSGQSTFFSSRRGDVVKGEYGEFFFFDSDRTTHTGVPSRSQGVAQAPLAPTYMHNMDINMHSHALRACTLCDQSITRVAPRRRSSRAVGGAANSRGSKRHPYSSWRGGFHFFGSSASHCSPAASPNSGSASHAQRTMPAGRTVRAFGLRLSVRPSATRTTRPGDQISMGSSVSLLKYFQQTSICLPTRVYIT